MSETLTEEINREMDHYFATVSDEQFLADLEAAGWREYAEMEDKAFNQIIARDAEI